MRNFRYKNQMRKLLVKVSDFDKMKAFNGLNSCQKDILKFGVILKHHEIDFCRTYMAKMLEKLIFGENEEE